MFSPKNVWCFLVIAFFACSSLVADTHDALSFDAPVEALQGEPVDIVQPAKKTVTSRVAQAMRTFYGFGLSAAGIVAIVDAFSNRSGTAMIAEAGLGFVALIAAFLAHTSWDGETTFVSDDYYCHHDDYCYDCYNHGHCYHEPVVYHCDPVVHHHETVQVVQPVIHQQITVVQPTGVVSMPSVEPVQPSLPRENSTNTELNNFWNDPFNY